MYCKCLSGAKQTPFPPELPIVQIGLRDWEMGKNYPSEIALRSDVKETLQKIDSSAQDKCKEPRKQELVSDH